MSTRDIMGALSANTTFSSLYPTLSKLASIVLIVHVSTADCERGFSTMNTIKTDQRNTVVVKKTLPFPPPSVLFVQRATGVRIWRSPRIFRCISHHLAPFCTPQSIGEMHRSDLI